MNKVAFNNMKNGYNRYQVDAKMEELITENEVLKKKLELYQQQATNVEFQLREEKERYRNLLSQLEIREKAAQDLAGIALREANLIVDTAKGNADMIIKEALMSARTILIEFAKLGTEANSIKGKMKEQLDLLNNALEEFEVPPIPDMDLLDESKYKD